MEVPIVISGGGIIGNYISLRLEKNNIKTVIVEKASGFLALDKGIRTVTLNEHSMQMLKNIGICPSIAQINSIDVLDGEGTGKIKFLAKDVGSENLSYVTYFNELQKLISDPCKERTFFNNEINSVQNLNTESDPEIMLKDGMIIKTNLIAGCDGRNSNIAKIASLTSSFDDYLQTALTFVVDIDNNSQGKAHQVFSEKGIFALMPLPEGRGEMNKCTVVWSIKNQVLGDEPVSEFVKNNISFFESKLNVSLKVKSEILSFKLSNHHFENYISGPVVLLGDAAHSIHPLAGQGINLGFADADVFCEEVISSYKKGIAFNEKSVLKRYEIRRKSMNFLMLKSMDFFVDLFGSENLYLRLIRNLGISSLNKSKFIKAFFIRHASGMNKF